MWFKKDKPIITFEGEQGFIDCFAQPAPAKNFIPEWYKKMKKRLSEHEFVRFSNELVQREHTMKACPPVLDYLTGGYIIPMPFDLMITNENGRQDFAYNVPMSLIGGHGEAQIEGSPYSGSQANKLTNPWFITTPKGYSCYFFKPHYADTMGIDILPAVVDTDMQHEVNFPFFFSGEENKDYYIPKGTPIAQVLPFKRQNWTMELKELSNRRGIYQNLIANTSFKSLYQDNFRAKKNYR